MTNTNMPLKKSSGVVPHIASLLCYLLMVVTAGLPLSGVIFLMIEQQDREVRFHAWQSIVLGVAWMTVLVVVGMLEFYLGQFSRILGWGLTMVRSILLTGLVATWAFAVWKTYRQESWQIPFAGEWARHRVDAE